MRMPPRFRRSDCHTVIAVPKQFLAQVVAYQYDSTRGKHVPPAFVTYLIPFGIPTVSFIVAIPLVMRKTPPNYFYGFRTRKTLSDSTIWYEANYLGGLNLLYASIAALCINGALLVFVPDSLFMLCGSVVTLITTMLSLVISMKQLRDL